MTDTHTLEILAPAGDPDVLRAALEAGADAVYLGLTSLNARRRARNFHPHELADAVTSAHAKGARVYLTLNTDIRERELGQAARILELARQSKVDAVLVRDPALFLLRPLLPELEFHLSTQTCMASSADVEAGRELGATRVVLARELSLAEMAAAAAVPGVETEVFVQGALCFCVSGRCLLSSWGGGHSGNRGTCTSPCRVPWQISGTPHGTPLSMLDLTTAHRLLDLAKTGVRALKIEGRLKTPEWVRDAVTLYRQALAGSDADTLRRDAEGLGAYTGRRLTDSYLDAQFAHLTGCAGREGAPSSFVVPPSGGTPSLGNAPPGPPEGGTTNLSGAVVPSGLGSSPPPPDPRPSTLTPADTYGLVIDVADTGISCRCTCAGQTTEWTAPRSVVRREKEALPVKDLLQWFRENPIQESRLEGGTSNAPDAVLPPRTVNGIMDRISACLHKARKPVDPAVRIDLPAAMRELLAKKDQPHPENRRCLGNHPDRVRLDAAAVERFLASVNAQRPSGAPPPNPRREGPLALPGPIPAFSSGDGAAPSPDGRPFAASASASAAAEAANEHRGDRGDAFPRRGGGGGAPTVVIDGATADSVGRLAELCGALPPVIALPPVFFEAEIAGIRALLEECRRLNLTVEVNSLGGWHLARECGLRMESGPGLPVLNSLAARSLGRLGLSCVTLSVEADRAALGDIAKACGVPCALVVYGRPALMLTRVALPDEWCGRVFEDRRGIRMIPRREGSLLAFRPAQPFDICGILNPALQVAHLVADLVAAPDPVAEWQVLLGNQAPTGFKFNYDRSLA
ncbi:MAG: hypothetical protein A3K19_12575 [Lentisphaerae bacterium RIFOXYB12_FULL_65_16]|nr:MAG: hypothetical protein A3K18_12100 [Lentisphaerae bacterium RIFOXYA12_64_32]OGV88118.1 MAG: hypothetical protein A3K19_12575 [Lentisphaerae bacterium RIFOXYB12_FULL_65_16]